MKRNFTRTIFFAMTVLIAAGCTIGGQHRNKKIDNARSSVVRVLTDEATGTAFIIAHSGTTTHLVTNLHVVQGASYVYIIPDNAEGSWLTATVTYLPDGLDLVLLTITSGLSNRPVLPLAKISTVNAADIAYALGFPGSADLPLADSNRLPSSTDDVTVTQGNISRVRVLMENGVDALQLNVNISGGNSGGPLLNHKGEVIGVNTWVNTAGSSLISYAIHIDYIINECESRGIPYKKASGFRIGFLWIVLGVSVVGLCFLLFIVIARRAKPAGASGGVAAAKPAAMSAATTAPQLMCTKGHFSGTTFPINGSLSIGRDPKQCQIIFPSDTKGISSLHCMIRQQGVNITLMDMGSSFGTFLAGGRKLNANESITLRSGDRFYLADNKNEFKVV